MLENLILYNGPTSPFGRKCKVTALVLKIEHQEEKINIYKSRFLDEHNPLRQVPTLMVIKQLQIVIIFVCILTVFQKQNLYFQKKDIGIV
jgi:glutathione S-transferase